MNWGYIAGFFDGEGCIEAIIRNKPNGLGGVGNFKLTFAQRTNSALETIQRFLEHHGIRSVLRYKKTGGKAHGGHCYYLCVGRRENVVALLKQISPFLLVKRVHAQDLIRFCTMFPRLKPGKN